ncbi:hypothetical protein ACS2QC_29480, partial [Bacillus cereus group sp. Bce033]|uniref:hypothetical protein n=1 Tax=Bacillus cereus group sp. Bce033 TaxID=3445235 RepID=UPI003F2805A5
RQDDDQRRQAMIARELRNRDMDSLMATIKDLQTPLPGNQVYLKCMKLKQELLAFEQAKLHAPAVAEADAPLEEPQPTVPEADGV